MSIIEHITSLTNTVDHVIFTIPDDHTGLLIMDTQIQIAHIVFNKRLDAFTFFDHEGSQVYTCTEYADALDVTAHFAVFEDGSSHILQNGTSS